MPRACWTVSVAKIGFGVKLEVVSLAHGVLRVAGKLLRWVYPSEALGAAGREAAAGGRASGGGAK